jgi:uncharacterized OsmC-like protein
MAGEGIRGSIEAAIEYLAKNPGEARYTDSAATALIGDGLQCRVQGPDGSVLVTDMPSSIGGGGEAPSPGWILRAALASCEATLIAMRAAHEGIELSRLEVTVDSESDDRGILGVDDRIPAGPLAVRILVRIAAEGSSGEALRDIVEWARTHCPVDDAVRRAVPTTVEVETG